MSKMLTDEENTIDEEKEASKLTDVEENEDTFEGDQHDDIPSFTPLKSSTLTHRVPRVNHGGQQSM
eukprot:CAMPEP_0198145154 /NCGR_PEP_ID=MMETSP1443-20131203/21384_1 /TAXON_ID=186043 /ORGANISM="Entomoneis sp., Strain CCMP2396" /LENGTH=65 /DNA_ID=CAMNT_0043808709 /DNA_START=9 /DNA_END=203 /DNA_ORIENTATION=+